MNQQWTWLQSHKKAVAGVLAGGIVIAAAGIWLVRSGDKKEQEPVQEKVYTVRVFTAESSGEEVSVKYTGLVQPQDIIQCYANGMGTIEKLLVKEGDTVVKGQVLAQLDTSMAQQQAQNSATALQGAQNTLDSLTQARDRARADYEAACDPVSSDKLKEARDQRDAAQTNLTEKQNELNRINGLLAPQEQKVETAQTAYQTALAAVEPAQEAANTAAQKQQSAAQTAQQAADRVTAAQQEYNTAAAEQAAASEAAAAAQTEVDSAQQALNQAASPEEQAAAQARLDAANEAKSQADAALNTAQNRMNEAQAEQQAAGEAKAAADADQAAADAEKAQADKALADAKSKETQTMTDLNGKQAELAAQKTSLGKASAETAVSTAQTQLNAKQAAVDALERQGETSEVAKAQRQRLDAAESALLQAQNFYNGAKQNNDNAQQAAADNKVVAPVSGSIVKLVGTEGGLASPLAPVAVIAGTEPVVQFGVSQSDVRTLQTGMDAVVTLDGKTYHGIVSSIALLPDEATRTYPVSVSVETGTDELFLGSMAQVELGVGEKTGVWLPLSVIMNDGEDYVYIVKDGHALRRDVQIAQVNDDKVLVNGLEAGCQIISQGMKTVRSGSAVQILDESGGSAE